MYIYTDTQLKSRAIIDYIVELSTIHKMRLDNMAN